MEKTNSSNEKRIKEVIALIESIRNDPKMMRELNNLKFWYFILSFLGLLFDNRKYYSIK